MNESLKKAFGLLLARLRLKAEEINKLGTRMDPQCNTWDDWGGGGWN